MSSQHVPLLKTLVYYLSNNHNSYALIIAGFHTGRATVARFFDLVTGTLHGTESGETEADLDQIRGKLRVAETFEVDVDLSRREWCTERAGETKDCLRRWSVVAVLARI